MLQLLIHAFARIGACTEKGANQRRGIRTHGRWAYGERNAAAASVSSGCAESALMLDSRGKLLNNTHNHVRTHIQSHMRFCPCAHSVRTRRCLLLPRSLSHLASAASPPAVSRNHQHSGAQQNWMRFVSIFHCGRSLLSDAARTMRAMSIPTSTAAEQFASRPNRSSMASPCVHRSCITVVPSSGSSMIATNINPLRPASMPFTTATAAVA